MSHSQTIIICPVQNDPEIWIECPTYEVTQKPDGSGDPPFELGCCDFDPKPYCPAEVRIVPVNGIGSSRVRLSDLFPDFTKLPRDTARAPLERRGEIEEIHSRECLFFADDTEETHLIRIYLLSVTFPGIPQFYWPVAFEVEGYQPGISLPTVLEIETEHGHPDYAVTFSGIRYTLLVERND